MGMKNGDAQNACHNHENPFLKRTDGTEFRVRTFSQLCGIQNVDFLIQKSHLLKHFLPLNSHIWCCGKN